jgi:CRP/FNR family transcriptional regulator, cyclic AMP receptor protein
VACPLLVALSAAHSGLSPVICLLAPPAQLSDGLLFLLAFTHSFGGSVPPYPLFAATLVASCTASHDAEKMELQRARRRRDELGHKPLCDRIRLRVLGESDARTRGRDVTAGRTSVDAERARGIGQRTLQDVAHHKGAQVRAAQGVPTDEVTETRREEPAALDRVPDSDRGVTVDLADPEERRDLTGRQPARLLQARDEALHDDVVGDHWARAFAFHRCDSLECRREPSAQTLEVDELHELDDRRIAEQEPRNRAVALGDDDDRHAVLACELDFDADPERGNARVRDDDGGARDMRAVDLVHGPWVEVRHSDGITYSVRQVGPQTGGLGDLGKDFVEQLRSRGVVERGQRSRDVRLAGGDRRLVRSFVHGPIMMLGASSCARRIRRMPEQRVSEYLRRLPLFSRLPDAELADLADRVRTKSFKRGEMIFRKDDPGTHLYMVLEGGVKIALPGEFGQEALVAIMRPGEFFGELALFDRSPRSASATALEDTRAALLAGDDFLAYLESHPASFRVVLETLARTIRRLSDRVEDLIFLDVPSRVAKYLLDLVRSSGGDGNELTLTQDELAAFIGASRVSVNRVLGDLERREIISIRRRRIAIKDADRLAKEVRF